MRGLPDYITLGPLTIGNLATWHTKETSLFSVQTDEFPYSNFKMLRTNLILDRPERVLLITAKLTMKMVFYFYSMSNFFLLSQERVPVYLALRTPIPANIYLFKVNNGNIRKRCEICSKLTIKTPERCQWRCSAVFIVNFERISHFFLVFPLLPWNK